MLSDRADAEEVTLDVYSQIWRGASSFRAERGTVIGWLIMVTRSRAIDRLRARRHRSSEAEVDALQDKPAADTHARGVDNRGRAAAPRPRRLSRFTRQPETLIELAWYGGYSHSELAGKMGLPLGTVKTRLRMALARLRQLLDPVGEQAQ